MKNAKIKKIVKLLDMDVALLFLSLFYIIRRVFEWFLVVFSDKLDSLNKAHKD